MKFIRRDPDKGYLDTLLWVPKNRVNVEGLKAALSPQIAPRGNTIQFLFLWKETQDHLLIPREFWELDKVDFEVIDCRPTHYTGVDIQSRIVLDVKNPEETSQKDALAALMVARGGVLQLACGKGKTVIALELAARLGVPTIVVVDTTVLLKQWQNEIAKHLDVPGGVGLIKDQHLDWKKPLVMATYHTLANRADMMPEEIRRWFGLVIWDEAHHVAAPTFCKSADLFYGRRYGLTATPIRDDGLHIVYNLHIGRVLYKNLKQDLKPRVYFKWTGFKIDGADPITKQMTEDKNGELHFGRLAGFFAKWPQRLDLILNEVNEATKEGRKILVLSNSLDECINLLALWNNASSLYTDVPVPTPQEVGETVSPVEIPKKKLGQMLRTLPMLNAQLQDTSLNPVKRQHYMQQKTDFQFLLSQHECFNKIQKVLRQRQRDYLEKLLAQTSDAGLIIQRVKPDVRDQMIRTKAVIFAIAKYGREGLDSPMLDTVIVCEPISSRNILQQIMGRTLRKKEGKKSPVVMFLEDDIGPMIGMCKKLRSHLLNWPVEDGGPYEYELIDHPSLKRRGNATWTTQRFAATP